MERPPAHIRVQDYPILRELCWSLPGATELTPDEALALYEGGWRHVDPSRLQAQERELLDALVAGPGRGVLLV